MVAPKVSAARREPSAEREPTACTTWRVLSWRAVTNRSAIQPVPRTPQRNGGASMDGGTRGLGRCDGIRHDSQAMS